MAGSAGLPAGVVSFVFTDIEGSTRLLRSAPDRYDDLLDLHHAVLRRVWAEHHGHVVDTEGDSFLVAFPDAADAVRAVTAAQRVIAATSWPTDLPVRIRAGVHTGYAQPHGRHYRALAVHQAARVTAAAHGGQILASDDTVRRLARVPDGARVTALGRFRVRDFDEPVRLHRIDADGTAVVGVVPRVQPADGHNLVRPSTSLLGRDKDIERVMAMLAPQRLVSIIGAGGVGKTRLAIEVGLRAVPAWRDGVWFVDLAAVTAPPAMASAVAAAVGAPSAPGADPWDDVEEHLRDRHALVLVDNCEHLLGPVGTALSRMTERASGIGVLATSRVPLGLRIERTYRLRPLVGGPSGHPGVDLFLERAADATSLDRDTVLSLVDELDGLPLAIELAAARTTALSPAEILSRLRSTISVLSSRDPVLPERQRSLDRLLDWSYDLLSPASRTVLLRLGAFAGSFDLDTAEQLCAAPGSPAPGVPEEIWSLVEHSLVTREVAAGATRFRLPATVRSYVRDRSEPQVVLEASTRLATIYLDRFGPGRRDDPTWVSEIGQELDNIRLVTQRLAGKDDAVAQQLAWAIGRYHDVTDAFRVGIDETVAWSRRLPSPTPARVALLTLLADLHLRLAELDEADAVLAGARTLAAQAGIPEWDDAGLARTSGEVALRRGDPAAARTIAEDRLRSAPSPRGRARLANLVGIARMMTGETRLAVHAFEDELAAATEAGADSFTAITHGNLAEAYLQLGDVGASALHQRLCLGQARSQHRPVLVAFSLMVAARIGQRLGRSSGDVVALQAVADRLLDEAGYALYPEDLEPRAELLRAAEHALGGAAFRRAEARGRAFDADDAADLADEILADAGRRAARAPRTEPDTLAANPLPGGRP